MFPQAFVSAEATSEQYHVFEFVRQLPRFSMYLLVPYSGVEDPSSYVTFQIVERVQRVKGKKNILCCFSLVLIALMSVLFFCS